MWGCVNLNVVYGVEVITTFEKSTVFYSNFMHLHLRYLTRNRFLLFRLLASLCWDVCDEVLGTSSCIFKGSKHILIFSASFSCHLQFYSVSLRVAVIL